MPCYDYECRECEIVEEQFHHMDESPEILCSKCGKPMKRIITGGSGFIMRKGGTRGTIQKFKRSSQFPTPTEAAQTKASAMQAEEVHNQNMAKDPYYQFRDKK